MGRRNNRGNAIIQDRRDTVWELRKAGMMSVRKIADALAKQEPPVIASRSTVQRDIAAVMEELRVSTMRSAEDWRTTLTARLEDLLQTYWTDARKGDPQKTQLVMQVLDRLMTLWVPKQVELMGTSDGALPVKIIEIVKQYEPGDTQDERT